MTTQNTKLIDISLIRQDGATQTRSALDAGHIEDIAEAMAGKDPHSVPPVTLFYDGQAYWLADGFHRVAAAMSLGRKKIAATVHAGTVDDAGDFACQANRAHGLKRSNADKRRAVESMLRRHPEWSDRRIAEHCGVGNQLVADVRDEVKDPSPDDGPQIRVGADGKSYPARVERPRPVAQAEPEQEPVPDPAPVVGKATPPRPKLVTDGAGRVVTDPEVIEALAEVPWFDDIANRLHAIKREILAKAETPVGAKLRANPIETDFKNIITAVRFARPFAQCPYRSCKTRGCDACKGTRWVNQDTWQNVPDRIKEAKP